MFNGVGGGGGAAMHGKGRNCGLRWWGEGRNSVRTSEKVRAWVATWRVLIGRLGAVSALMWDVDDGSSEGLGRPSQNERWKSRDESTIPPDISIIPSNQSSQLMLQLGRKRRV